jgi:hypothetical protein
METVISKWVNMVDLLKTRMHVNKAAVWIAVLVALLIIGCGGGGGGGDTTGTTSTTQTTDGGTTGVQTGIYGNVRTSRGMGLSGAVVRFFNAGGNQVGQTTTNSAGNFGVNLPTTARSFTVDASNATFVDSGNTYTGAYLFNQFAYNNEEYLADEPTCYANAPSFATGQAVPLASSVVFLERWLGPPPPPSGCL